MIRARTLRLAAAAMLLAAFGSACANQVLAGNPGLCRSDDPENLTTVLVPPLIGGLDVRLDKKSTKTLNDANKTTPSYMCDAAVFSLRQGKELRAILTFERLTSDAEPDNPDFRTRIVEDVSGSSRPPDRVGDALVYKTKSSEKLFAIWFKARFLGTLIVREDLTFSGAVDFDRLLVEALSLEPEPAA